MYLQIYLILLYNLLLDYQYTQYTDKFILNLGVCNGHKNAANKHDHPDVSVEITEYVDWLVFISGYILVVSFFGCLCWIRLRNISGDIHWCHR